mmetsp:Transcript_142882/g.249226  ORF Transcript_142882/g.249226 Transcript_142882/m.249226 type:complete len:241 (-) Transcript_142882:1098-1820(-)
MGLVSRRNEAFFRLMHSFFLAPSMPGASSSQYLAFTSAPPCLARRVGWTQSNVSMPARTPLKMSRTPPMPSRWMGRSWRHRRAVYVTMSCIMLLVAPRLPPMAVPKKGWLLVKSMLSRRRSSYTPPWMMPYSACVPSSVRMNSSRDRTAHRCERRVDAAVYSLSTLNGVHSSSTRIRSAPNSRCTWIDRSGLRRCSLPSTKDRKTASFSVSFTDDVFQLRSVRLPLISLETDPYPMEKIW